MILPLSKIDKAELCTFNHTDASQSRWQDPGGRSVPAIQPGLPPKVFYQRGRDGLGIEVLHRGRTAVMDVH